MGGLRIADYSIAILGHMSQQNTLTINQGDFLIFIDRALDKMTDIVSELGDDLANQKPDLPGANSPYAILTHCIGVIDYWIGSLIAGRGIPRDRPAEFTAQGKATDIRSRVDAVKNRLREDIPKIDGLSTPKHGPIGYNPTGGPENWTEGAALIHTYEELAQHLGHMDITRDILLHGMSG